MQKKSVPLLSCDHLIDTPFRLGTSASCCWGTEEVEVAKAAIQDETRPQLESHTWKECFSRGQPDTLGELYHQRENWDTGVYIIYRSAGPDTHTHAQIVHSMCFKWTISWSVYMIVITHLMMNEFNVHKYVCESVICEWLLVNPSVHLRARVVVRSVVRSSMLEAASGPPSDQV